VVACRPTVLCTQHTPTPSRCCTRNTAVYRSQFWRKRVSPESGKQVQLPLQERRQHRYSCCCDDCRRAARTSAPTWDIRRTRESSRLDIWYEPVSSRGQIAVTRSRQHRESVYRGTTHCRRCWRLRRSGRECCECDTRCRTANRRVRCRPCGSSIVVVLLANIADYFLHHCDRDDAQPRSLTVTSNISRLCR